MNARFTIDGSDASESRLAELCEMIGRAVRKIVPADRLEALLLGGGYGRGEGGVLRAPQGDQPYNDLEFYALIRGPVLLNERRYGRALHALGERLTPAAGLDVEFKVLSLDRLSASPISMFYYDLVAGHRCVLGPEGILDGCERHRHPENIPLHEATRLLMNRCSGLLFALERLQRPVFGAEDADFVGRNLAKAQLAFGDVALTARGRYHKSCRERLERLRALTPAESMPWLDAVRGHHSEGVEFKLHPRRCEDGKDLLGARHAELSELGRAIWLWLEERRLCVRFASTREYALSSVDKCPETSPWRNRLVHLKTAGLAAALRPEASRYPRQRLFQTLPLLLWEPAAMQPADFAGSVEAYARWWRRFN